MVLLATSTYTDRIKFQSTISIQSMYKFLVTSPGTSSPSVVIPSPRSAAEKRLDNALLRIVKLFPVPDHKEFQQACEFALNVISESQIREIPYEEIRYALLKHRDHKKDVTARWSCNCFLKTVLGNKEVGFIF